MQKYQSVVQQPNGDVVPFASVLVQTDPGGVNATLYSDDGVTPVANPLTTDQYGNFAFYAENGLYQLTITRAGFTTANITGILLSDFNDTFLWTPTDGSGAGLSFAANSASCTKIGDRVFINVQTLFPPNASGAAVIMSGLPYPTEPVISAYGQAAGIAGVIGAPNMCATWVGGSNIRFSRLDTGASPVNSDFASRLMRLNFSYRTLP